MPHFRGGFGHGKKGSATREGANPSGSLEKGGKIQVLSAGGSGEALRQRGRERRGGRQAEEMKASILSCLWLAAWNTPPWRLLPQISLFLHREGGDVLGASRGERAALGLFVFGWVLFFSPPQVSKSCCFQLVACITPGLKMHLAGLGIFASQEGHQARASDFWSSHLHNLLLVALQKDGRPSHEPLWLGAANVVIRHCSFWGERAKKPLFGFREKRRVRNA